MLVAVMNVACVIRNSEGPDGPQRPLTGWASQQVQRRRYLKKLPLQANFYPMPVMAYIQDAQRRLTLHTAQALGVSSLSKGERGAGGHEGSHQKQPPAMEACPLPWPPPLASSLSLSVTSMLEKG